MKMKDFKITRYGKKNYFALTTGLLILLMIGYFVFLIVSREKAGVTKPLSNIWFNPPTFLFSIDGTGAGALQEPVAVTASPDGRIFVADPAAADIKVYDAEGTFKYTFKKLGNTGQLQAPVGVAINGQTVLVSDSALNQIFIFSLDGQYKGNLISNENKAKLTAFTPVGVKVVSNNIYFTDILFHRVVKTDLNGNLINTLGGPGEQEGRLAFPNDVAVSPSEKIYVSDSNNFRVQVSEDGKSFHLFKDKNSPDKGPIEGALVRGITVDKNGFIWVVDTLNHCVSVFNEDAEPVYVFGGSSSGAAGLTGTDTLFYPNGINVDRNRVYIADRGNHVVRVYRR